MNGLSGQSTAFFSQLNAGLPISNIHFAGVGVHANGLLPELSLFICIWIDASLAGWMSSACAVHQMGPRALCWVVFMCL